MKEAKSWGFLENANHCKMAVSASPNLNGKLNVRINVSEASLLVYF